MKAAWAHPGRNRCVGPDDLAAEILQAGGEQLAWAAVPSYLQVVDGERWPVEWMGGRIQEIHKMKSPLDECDEYVGIVLDCHAGRGLRHVLALCVMGAPTPSTCKSRSTAQC